MKKILKNIELGEQCSIINILYYAPYSKSDKVMFLNNRYEEDALIIIYKNADGEKKLKIIKKPEQEIWFTKPEYRHEWKYTRESIEKDKVYPVMVRPKNVLKRIYEELKNEDYDFSKTFKDLYHRSFQTNNYRLARELHKYPHVFMSDFSVEDSYRFNLALQYDLTKRTTLKKSFMDIETDIMGLTNEETHELHYDPVTAISLVLDYNPQDPKDETIQVYGLFARDYDKFSQQEDWEKNLEKWAKEYEKEFNNMELCINNDRFIHPQKYKVHLLVLDNEAELIKTYFKLLNASNPDVNSIWNISFDIVKLKNRARYLGLDFLNMISHPSIPEELRYLNISIDRRPGVSFSNNNTHVVGTTGYLFVDQMYLYAGMTKGSPSEKYSLDFIGEKEVGIGKVKFDKGVTIKNIAYKDYPNFARYSLKDTVLLQVIDHYTAHIDLMFINTQTEACSPIQTVRPTKEIRNYYSLKKLQWGRIPGNNPNTDNINGMNDVLYEFMQQQLEKDEFDEDGEEDDELVKEIKEVAEDLESRLCDTIEGGVRKLGGGMVMSPHLNNHNGVIILGEKSKNLYILVVDMDFTAEYPNVKITRNCGMETEIGRLVIESKVSDEQDTFKNAIYLPGAEFISDYIAKDWLSMGRAYFNLPSVDDIIKKYGRK